MVLETTFLFQELPPQLH